MWFDLLIWVKCQNTSTVTTVALGDWQNVCVTYKILDVYSF